MFSISSSPFSSAPGAAVQALLQDPDGTHRLVPLLVVNAPHASSSSSAPRNAGLMQQTFAPARAVAVTKADFSPGSFNNETTTRCIAWSFVVLQTPYWRNEMNGRAISFILESGALVCRISDAADGGAALADDDAVIQLGSDGISRAYAKAIQKVLNPLPHLDPFCSAIAQAARLHQTIDLGATPDEIAANYQSVITRDTLNLIVSMRAWDTYRGAMISTLQDQIASLSGPAMATGASLRSDDMPLDLSRRSKAKPDGSRTDDVDQVGRLGRKVSVASVIASVEREQSAPSGNARYQGEAPASSTAKDDRLPTGSER